MRSTSKASQATPPSSESAISDSDTSSDATRLLEDVNDGTSKGQDAQSKPLEPSKKPGKCKWFFSRCVELIALILVLLVVTAIVMFVVALFYIAGFSVAMAAKEVWYRDSGTAGHSTKSIRTITIEPATVTITTTSTTISTTIATPEPTPQHIVEKSGLPDGFPVSLGLWKQLARKQYYHECFQGCGAEDAGCDAYVAGKWETACRQTDRLYYGDVDCSAANLLEAAGGRLGDEVPIPEVCLDKMARCLQKVRGDWLEAKEKAERQEAEWFGWLV